MLDIRRLRFLVELHHRGTLAAVAEALSYSPSTVSEQLKALEQDAGVPLLEQSGRRVRLTPAALTLVEHAEVILDRMADAESDLAASTNAVGGTIRIATLQSATYSVIPKALTSLAATHPLLRVEVAELPPEEGLFEVAARGFDLVIAEEYPGTLRERPRELDHVAFVHDPIRAAVAPDDAARSFTDLAERAWVFEPAGTATRDWAMQVCRAAGFEPDVRFETADLNAHLHLIRTGHAVGLLPDLLWAGGTPTARLIDVPGEPQRTVYSATRHAAASRPAVRAVRAALAASAQ